ncbi:NAD(+) synthase [Spiroplasma endosymbiont of Virgichneumon dumeticola]|uniref:NAD(+) synthase n=1 Tax=Spiroplasma endosymbiont of Virgichneumon dumeticola TaxID=3139323 RepID=UPI0035C8AAC5
MVLTEYLKVIIKFLQIQVTKTKSKGVIVGLSGGIDSAVVSLLMKEAFPDNHLCVILPCQSDPIDVEYAQKLVNTHGLRSQIVDLTPTFYTLKTTINSSLNFEKTQLVLGNIKARLRMATLYALGQNENYLVVGTDNADEWHIGYFTKYGDGGVDLLPIIHLLKQDVINSAKLLGVTPEIIARKPTASLFPGQTDESEMQFKYEQLDQYLLGNKIAIPSDVITRIEIMHKNSEHKRIPLPQAPKWNRK